jgi:hypothetical protein
MYTYILVPIAAGADKFVNLLTSWEQYLSPALLSSIPIEGAVLMKIVGVIEIAAGILVSIKTKLGAYIVAAWLLLIALSLIFTGRYLDVAVRDIVMAIGAFCLAKLSSK